MTWTAPLQHRNTARLDQSRVLGFALFGVLVVVLASGLAYLGSLVWAANWPVIDTDAVERVVQTALLVFIIAWMPVGSLTRLVFNDPTTTTQAAVAASLWGAWCSVGPIRTISLAIFALAALLITMLILPFVRAARGTRAPSQAVPEGAAQ